MPKSIICTWRYQSTVFNTCKRCGGSERQDIKFVPNPSGQETKKLRLLAFLKWQMTIPLCRG